MRVEAFRKAEAVPEAVKADRKFNIHLFSHIQHQQNHQYCERTLNLQKYEVELEMINRSSGFENNYQLWN